MKLTISKTVQEETEITLPAFYKSKGYSYTEYLGIFSANDCRKLLSFSANHYLMGNNYNAKDEATIIGNGEVITEEEFMTAYESALQSLSFKATLIEKAEA